MQATNRTETEDLVEWMISLNLDLCNDTRLSTVDAVDMIVRCNLDFGLEVIFSITFHPIFFVGKMPAAHFGYSQADTAWWFWRGTVSKEHRSGVYIQLLRLYGVTSPRDELLAGKIMKYEKELQRIIKRTTPEEDTFQYGTIESMGELTKPYVTSNKWSTMFMTYTNLVYKGNSTIAYQEHVLKVLVKLLKYKAVGNDGLCHLIAWSLLRQLARYTKPESTADQNVNHLCIARVLMVMKMAVISPYLRMTVTMQMIRDAEAMMAAIVASFRSALASSTWLRGTAREAALRKLDHMKYHVGNPSGRRCDAAFVEELYAPLPDVTEDRFFTSWREALALSRHQTWADQTAWQYDAAEVNAAYYRHANVALLPTAILHQPFFFADGPLALNYGGSGSVRKANMLNDCVSKCDFSSTLA
ncbi:neprilysin-2-like [Rhipicephalus microplus]|uniref:neprilysin-2-like n=1 Tax=Rhipicephalus microplus TaxID=6941 RepID=UPI003F6A6CEE